MRNMHTIEELRRHRHTAVRDYFQWVMRQDDAQSLELQNTMRETLHRPRNKYGRIEEKCKKSDEEIQIYPHLRALLACSLRNNLMTSVRLLFAYCSPTVRLLIAYCSLFSVGEQ